jgi:hypothetical protein
MNVPIGNKSHNTQEPAASVLWVISSVTLNTQVPLKYLITLQETIQCHNPEDNSHNICCYENIICNVGNLKCFPQVSGWKPYKQNNPYFCVSCCKKHTHENLMHMLYLALGTSGWFTQCLLLVIVSEINRHTVEDYTYT